MALIVYLTDLHLGDKGAARPSDDRKVPVITDAERTSIRDVARRHLVKLTRGIRRRGETISALVLGGDITFAALPGGYADLKPFLEECFDEYLPDPARIIATPGNHDVVWYSDDPKKRYEQFVEFCVNCGYVTPPLEGIDLDGPLGRWTPAEHHILVEERERWFIVPMNTSNWSGTRAALTDLGGARLDETEVEVLRAAMAKDPLRAHILDQLLRFRQYDIARVSKEQLRAFEESVNLARSKMPDGGPGLAIAVMHHQLAPVGEREEIKPFEALSNLGRVRAALEDAAIGIAIHGHKHDQLTMWNTVERGSRDGRATAKHEMLVVSGGTIGGNDASDQGRFATILKIESASTGHEVTIMSSQAYLDNDISGTKAYFVGGRRFEPLPRLGGQIEASSFDDAYARLLYQGVVAGNEAANNISVTVTDLGSIAGPPKSYPADAAGGSRVLPLDQWFGDVAAWWQSQLVEAPRGVFTHGRRLRLHRGVVGADQVAAMVRILDEQRRPSNGRAVATLIDAEIDILGEERAGPATFPAFCLLQLHIRTQGGKALLDATAYFRKQEMRYWWPVNIAEIKLVMEEVLSSIKDAELGAITTVAAVAVWQGSRSRVSIPYVDRLYLKDKNGRVQLMRMAAMLGRWPNPEEKRPEIRLLREHWDLALEDVVPPADAIGDSIPIAVEGLGFLKQAVEAQVSVASDVAIRKRLEGAANFLATLEEHGESLWKLGREAKQTNFRERLARHIGAMSDARDRLQAIICEVAAPVQSDAGLAGGAAS